ncbi:MAG TPA: cytochrome P450 [Porticoccaceae bacterium]|nr:cytochrome P450 [Porticoccaceae bacterium]
MTAPTVDSVKHLVFEDFDPFSAAFRADPTAYHSDLLAKSPAFIAMEGDIASAYVAKFDQCLQVLGNWEQFSSVKPKGLPGMQRVDFFNSMPVMNYSDPPQHDRLRRVVNVAFSPGRVRQLAEATDTIIDQLLGRIEAGQAFDGMADIGKPLAVKVLFDEFLGIPPKDQHIFFEFGATFFLLDKLKLGDPKPKEYLDAWARGEAYLRDVLAQAGKTGGDNVLAMIAAASESGTMSDAEMMAMVCVLFTGGVPTVSAMSASAIHYLAAHPEIAERIRQDESLAKPFCEEVFRLDAPVTLVMRFATEDVEVGPQTLLKGMPVYTMISVANRDPEVYDNPLEFSVDRKNMRHLAFGNGTHVCIGNAITRMILPKLVVEAARRLPGLRLDPNGEGVWETSPRSRHRLKVPVIA